MKRTWWYLNEMILNEKLYSNKTNEQIVVAQDTRIVNDNDG